MNVLLPLPVVLPITAAAVSLLLHGRRNAQRAVSIVVVATLLIAAVMILVAVERDTVVATQMGGWEAPIGITFVADRFAAIMLVVSAAMVALVLVYALGQLSPRREDLYFHPLYLVLAGGVCASFLTGDLFNLFVAFEVMLMASYVLLTLGGSSRQVRAGMTYMLISVIASTLFVAGVAFVYAATGTVNMADLSQRLADVPGWLREALGLLFLVVFGIKASLFPLFFWLPASYPSAPSPIAALFAGLLTKVGVYAIFRTQTLLFPGDGGPSTLLLAIAGATMLFGVLGAIAQQDIKRVLSFHIVSQIGYMILGLGLFSIAGLAGGILYIVHHIIVKTALFLVGGMVEEHTGTQELGRLGGLARTSPLLAGLFLLPALSLAGVPPLSGFVAKLALVQAGLDLERGLVIAVSLFVSLLTLFSMTKIWGGAFWGGVERPAASPSEQRLPTAAGADVAPERHPRRRLPAPMVAATVAMVALSLVVSVAAEPLYALSERAAADLLDASGYVSAVLGAGS